MMTLGLDIGTTTISAVVISEGKLIFSKTKKNDSVISSDMPQAKLQDPEIIIKTIMEVADEAIDEFPQIQRIGITGQQHGILYVDENGMAISPLFTWQDKRGDLDYSEGMSYARYLSERTGYKLYSGYGLVTHFYNFKNNLVPKQAKSIYTICDYVAMRLSGKSDVYMNGTMAASIGLYDVKNDCFDIDALRNEGFDISLIPECKNPRKEIGFYKESIKVYQAIGDNQASFLGATKGDYDCALVNIGTGSQVSVYSDKYIDYDTLEVRPHPIKGYLLVGAALCGGKSYALLQNFYRQVCEMMGLSISDDECYEKMYNSICDMEINNSLPVVSPIFMGTRQDPDQKAYISGLTDVNFTPANLTLSLLSGMVRELYDMFEVYENNSTIKKLYGSGNGIRKNEKLQDIVKQTFNIPLEICDIKEEAATGAAYFASLM